MSDENDLCKKRSPADVEGQDKIKDDKIKNTDGAKTEESNDAKLKVTDAPKTKLVVDSTDGGSDSGVENPAYNETETSSNGTRRDEPKTG